MKVSFSLANAKAKAKPAGEAPSLKKPITFASLEDDEPIDAAPTAGSSKGGVNKQMVAQSVEMSRAMKKRLEEEKKVDATVFEYDEVYDKMQAMKEQQKVAKEADARERKPKYISGLLTAAATRRLDHLRAEEKLIQREREMEGDEFKDKEEFVTEAYKKQMEEVRQAEAEEKQREEMERKKNKGMGTGMAHFYRKLLEESEAKHEETVAATTEKPVQGPAVPNLTITRPPEMESKSDAELARAAREQGKDVELNDDNQIVDKRELLSAGLNLSAPNTRKLGLQLSKKGTSEGSVQAHRAVGSAASRREINERRAREIATQMGQERERIMEEKEREEEERLNRVVAKRNTSEDVQSARERYLARKRRKLEEVQAGSGEGEDVVSS